MKLQVLVDNNIYIDEYYLGEPAVSYYIEEDGKRILFDTGYSDILLRNAELMDIDLSALTHIVFSHGHNDHTRGFQFLSKGADLSQVSLIAHPDCFLPKEDDTGAFGAPFSREEAASSAKLVLSSGPVPLTDRLIWLGEIPRQNDFEAKEPVGKQRKDEDWADDFVLDDTALAYKGRGGLFIITGCSHSGICNICQYAQAVTGKPRILGIIGGFHLFGVTPQLTATIDYFKTLGVTDLYPCHCVDFAARAAIHEQLPIREVGVGLTLEW